MYLSKPQNIFVPLDRENDEERWKVKLAPSPATWWQIVHPGESQPKPGGFPHNPPPGFIMHHWEILRFLEIFAIYFQLSQTIFLERFLFQTMNGGGGSVDSLRGIREFDSCLSARVWVEVFAQVSSMKIYSSQLQMYLSEPKIVFPQNVWMYMSLMQTFLVQIHKRDHICLNSKMYLSQLNAVSSWCWNFFSQVCGFSVIGFLFSSHPDHIPIPWNSQWFSNIGLSKGWGIR